MIVAAGDPSNFADPINWIQWGVLGLVVLGFLTGWIHPRSTIERVEKERDRLLAERDKADDQRDAMAETFQKELLPVLTKFLTTTEALLPLLQRMVEKSGGDHR